MKILISITKVCMAVVVIQLKLFSVEKAEQASINQFSSNFFLSVNIDTGHFGFLFFNRNKKKSKKGCQFSFSFFFCFKIEFFFHRFSVKNKSKIFQMEKNAIGKLFLCEKEVRLDKTNIGGGGVERFELKLSKKINGISTNGHAFLFPLICLASYKLGNNKKNIQFFD